MLICSTGATLNLPMMHWLAFVPSGYIILRYTTENIAENETSAKMFKSRIRSTLEISVLGRISKSSITAEFRSSVPVIQVGPNCDPAKWIVQCVSEWNCNRWEVLNWTKERSSEGGEVSWRNVLVFITQHDFGKNQWIWFWIPCCLSKYRCVLSSPTLTSAGILSTAAELSLKILVSLNPPVLRTSFSFENMLDYTFWSILVFPQKLEWSHPGFKNVIVSNTSGSSFCYTWRNFAEKQLWKWSNKLVQKWLFCIWMSFSLYSLLLQRERSAPYTSHLCMPFSPRCSGKTVDKVITDCTKVRAHYKWIVQSKPLKFEAAMVFT